MMTTAMKTLMAAQYAAQVVVVSLHTGNPGSTGTNELTGGGYARQTLSWGTPAAGAVTASPVSFNVPADTDVAYLGFWSSGSVTFLDSWLVNVSFVSAGVYQPTIQFEQIDL